MRPGSEGGGEEARSSSILEDTVGIYGCEITSYRPHQILDLGPILKNVPSTQSVSKGFMLL